MKDFSELEKPGGVESRNILKVSPTEIAEKAYFIYVEEGFPQGRDVQHWLEAEAQITRQVRTRVHGPHN